MALSSSASEEHTLRDLQIKAQKAYSAGDYVTALRLFVEWANLTPENHKARERIADTLHHLGQTDKAVVMYKKLAEEYMAHGSLIKAIAIQKTILTLDPENKEVKEHLLEIFGSHVPEELTPIVKSKTAATLTRPSTSAPVQKKKFSKDITAEDLGLDQVDELDKPKSSHREMDELNMVFHDILGEDTELREFVPEEGPKNPQEAFRRTPLFSDLKPEELDILMDRLNLQDYQAGQIICQEGDPADVMWMIVQGEVNIQTRKMDGTFVQLAILGEGDFFGEGGFITGGVRTASAIAKNELQALEMTRHDFNAITDMYPRIKELLYTFYENRLADLVMAKSELFGLLPSFRRAELLQSFQTKDYSANDVILTGDNQEGSLYLVKTGEVEIAVVKDGKRQVIDTLKPGDSFGELNFLVEKSLPYLAISKSDAQLLFLRKIEVEGIMQMFPEAIDILKRTADKRKKRINEVM